MNIAPPLLILLVAAGLIIGVLVGIPVGRELESAKRADLDHDRGGEEW